MTKETEMGFVYNALMVVIFLIFVFIVTMSIVSISVQF